MEVPPSAPDWPLAAAAADGASLCRWEAGARSSRSIGRSTLGDAKLSKGCCSPLSDLLRLQRRLRYSSSFFSPFSSPPRSYVYSIISSAVGEEGRARSSEATYTDRFPVSGSRKCTSARSVRLFPLAYIAIRLCCEWIFARSGRISSRAAIPRVVNARVLGRQHACGSPSVCCDRFQRAFSYRSPCWMQDDNEKGAGDLV